MYRDANRFQGTITRVHITVDTAPFSVLEMKRFIDAIGVRV